MAKREAPIARPNTLQEAYVAVLDIAERVNAVRACAISHPPTLQLSPETKARLTEAHQALLAAHRLIENELTS